jgi:propanol-preferring alcohol dehydrogenase
MRRRGSAHIVLVTSGSKAAYDTAFYCVRPTGTLLAVGLPAEISFPPIMMAAGEVNIKASAVGTRKDLEQVLALAAEGKLHCQVATRPLAEVNAVIEEMRSGKISGRIVLTM